MHRIASRRSRFCPRIERLESLDLPSAVGALPAPAFVNLTHTPVADDAKTYLAASTPAQGRQKGVVNALVAVPDAGGDIAVAGVMTLQYRVKVLPSFLTPFSPSVSFTMRVNFATSLDDPRPGDVSVSYSKNLIPNGASVRAKVVEGIVAFLRHDRAAIAGTLGQS
jgi:hypothetical protein